MARTPPSDPWLARAVRFLASRPRTSKELRDRLVRAGASGADAERAVGRLTDEGLLDDGATATTYATYGAGRGRGPRRVLADLARRGIPRDLAEEALARGTRSGAIDFEAALAQNAVRRVRRLGSHRDLRAKARVYNALLRDGFDADAVERALAIHFDPEDDTAPETDEAAARPVDPFD